VTAPAVDGADAPVVRATGLHRFYRRGGEEVAALRDVSLAVAPGETLAVMGPSGSGKSTLLNVLAGLDDPDGGSVWIGGDELSHRPPAVQARMRGRSIGVLTQTSGLIDHLDVLDNLILAAGFREHRSDVPQLHEMLDRVGLGRRAHARPSTLSGGETARANLAVALAGSPLLVLADEPTAEVSSEEEEGVLELLRTVRPPGSATVLVTHSRRVADSADRTVHLLDGRVA
jgi:putative ABC transport system ATP-binding protein